MQLDLAALPPAEVQAHLQSCIAPRPICFASTVDAAGRVNLSPFSFFNLFSANPPVAIFSPALRVRDGTRKHTLDNVRAVPEVVINIVDYDMVQQMSLASCEYPAGVDEFTKAGFTAEPATLVRPPMVAESKVKLECRVTEIKPLGTEGGAGNLIFAQVLRLHLADDILGPDGRVDPLKLRLVARLGGDWYLDARPEYLFKLPKPNARLGIGVDALPPGIRLSSVLTGNHLGQLANVSTLPGPGEGVGQAPADEPAAHRRAAALLDAGRVEEAWQVLLGLPVASAAPVVKELKIMN